VIRIGLAGGINSYAYVTSDPILLLTLAALLGAPGFSRDRALLTLTLNKRWRTVTSSNVPANEHRLVRRIAALATAMKSRPIMSSQIETRLLRAKAILCAFQSCGGRYG
jgi:hypothetical protein